MLKKDSTSNNGYIDESKQKESKRNEKEREEVEGAKKRINRFLGWGKGMSSVVGLMEFLVEFFVVSMAVCECLVEDAGECES